MFNGRKSTVTQDLLVGRRAVNPAIAAILLVAVALILPISSALIFAYVAGGHIGLEQITFRSVAVFTVSNRQEPTDAVLLAHTLPATAGFFE